MDNKNSMQGVFLIPIWKYILALLFLVTGSFIAIRFALWGVEAIRLERIAEAVFCFGFVIVGLLFGVSAIALFKHNHKACLTVNDQRIDAQFGFGEELHESLSSIRKVTLLPRGTGIELYLTDRFCQIGHLRNAKEICSFILSANSGVRPAMRVDDAMSNLSKHKKRFIKYLVLTAVFTVMIFAHIGWCVLLTEGKDLGAFSQGESMVFLGCAAAELVTVAISLFLANRCGKQKKILDLCQVTLVSATAKEQRNKSLEKYPNVIGKKFFDDNRYRIVIFAPESDVFAYMLERFDLSAKDWVACYDAAKGFRYLSDLYENIEECFDSVILED